MGREKRKIVAGGENGGSQRKRRRRGDEIMERAAKEKTNGENENDMTNERKNK